MNVIIYFNKHKKSIKVPNFILTLINIFKVTGVVVFIVLILFFLSSYFFSFLMEYQLIRYQNKEVMINIYQQKNGKLEYKLANMVNEVVQKGIIAGVSLNFSSIEDFGYGGGAYNKYESYKKNIDILYGVNKNILQNLFYYNRNILNRLKGNLDLVNSEPSISPVNNGYVTSTFGWRIHPIFHTYDFHKGLDLVATNDKTIYCPADGVVIKKYFSKSYGNMIEIQHNAHFKTVYAHLKSSSVQLGDSVKKGQKIAIIGNTGRSTGPHLHYEVRYDDKPIDPQNYIYPKNELFD